MALRGEYRVAWSGAGGVVMLAFLGLATLAWQSGDGTNSQVPEPAFAFFVAGVVFGLYLMVAPLLHLPPYRTKQLVSVTESPAAVQQQPIAEESRKRAERERPKPEQAKPKPAGRTPEYLAGLCKGRTSAQAENLVRPYIGREITVTGEILEVDPWDLLGGAVQVSLGEGAPSVFFRFADKSAHDSVIVLNLGERITGRGVITAINVNWITLERCDLVSVG